MHEFATNPCISQHSRPQIAGGIFIGIPLQPVHNAMVPAKRHCEGLSRGNLNRI